ncbi:MAG TPA: hypothetical protein PLZ94_19735, partial [Armatimonadota bacterium]|nr:hypothetical protein [Armatimonadota bacterium]
MCGAIVSGLLLLAAVPPLPAQGEDDWQSFYDGSFRLANARAWVSDLTRSAKTAQGLHIVDPSQEKGSARLYFAPWIVDREKGIEAEARLKSVSCSEGWGVVLSLADGMHEEGITFYPDRVELSHARVSAAFNTADAFHTYRVRCQGTDIEVWADGHLLIDGKGKFSAPAHSGRCQIAFGSGSSTAMGEAYWEYVRFRGAKTEPKPKMTVPKVPGLEIVPGEVRTILPDRQYVSMFKRADGALIVGDRCSRDGGQTWERAESFHVGAYQFPD